MPEQNTPNDASRRSKTEGERWDEKDSAGGGISNRPADEEIASQDAVPDRGDSRPGSHAGHGDDEPSGRSER